MAKVTVFMPVYNTNPDFLHTAINSILNQTYQDYELLIIDDGSQELNISYIINLFSDKRINFQQHKEHHGLTFIRNQGLREARGKYIALMDSDDIAFPYRLREQVEYMDSHPECGVFSSIPQNIGTRHQNSVRRSMTHDEIKMQLMYDCCISNPSSILRLSVIQKNAITYDNIISAEDYALWTKLIFYTQFYISEKPFIQYRHHAKNYSRVHHNITQNLCKYIQDRYISHLFQTKPLHDNIDYKWNLTDSYEMFYRMDKLNEKHKLFPNKIIKQNIALSIFYSIKSSIKQGTKDHSLIHQFSRSPYWKYLTLRHRLQYRFF